LANTFYGCDTSTSSSESCITYFTYTSGGYYLDYMTTNGCGTSTPIAIDYTYPTTTGVIPLCIPQNDTHLQEEIATLKEEVAEKENTIKLLQEKLTHLLEGNDSVNRLIRQWNAQRDEEISKLLNDAGSC